jgi:hypothetical protein
VVSVVIFVSLLHLRGDIPAQQKASPTSYSIYEAISPRSKRPVQLLTSFTRRYPHAAKGQSNFLTLLTSHAIQKETNHCISRGQVSKLESLADRKPSHRTAGLIRKRRLHLRHRNNDELLVHVSWHGRGVHNTELRSYESRGPNINKPSFQICNSYSSNICCVYNSVRYILLLGLWRQRVMLRCLAMAQTWEPGICFEIVKKIKGGSTQPHECN